MVFLLGGKTKVLGQFTESVYGCLLNNHTSSCYLNVRFLCGFLEN